MTPPKENFFISFVRFICGIFGKKLSSSKKKTEYAKGKCDDIYPLF